MRSLRLWTLWLVAVLGAVAAFGFTLALVGPATLLGDFFRLYTRALWDTPDIPAETAPFARWAFAVIGSTFASWAIALLFVAARPFARGERWAWWCIAMSVVVWFVLDTILSFAAGVWPNAIFNAGVLLLFLPPLIATKGKLGKNIPPKVSGEIVSKPLSAPKQAAGPK